MKGEKYLGERLRECLWDRERQRERERERGRKGDRTKVGDPLAWEERRTVTGSLEGVWVEPEWQADTFPLVVAVSWRLRSFCRLIETF